MRQVIECDWTWTGAGFDPDIQVAVGPDGTIEDVGRLGLKPTKRLPKRALLPGMVNVHSHAFQRGLRGRGDRFPAGAGTFWSWRDAMYDLVDSLDHEAFYRLTLQAFREMRRAGITTVGEFHYLHHSRDQADFAFDPLVLRAAGAAQIRLVLLHAFYKTGGIGQPLAAVQRRFKTESIEAYWEQLETLSSRLEPHQSVGVVVHSIRAAKLDDIATLQSAALRRQMRFHIHVEEQRKEVEDAIAAYGQPPMAALTSAFGDMSNVTAVHCTHTDPADLERFIQAGGTVCVCPLTEGNLGDGLPGLPGHHPIDGRITLGTDSNARICMTEEMRWLEYGQRLRHETRGAHVDPDGWTARRLFQIATENGASALGVPAGTLAPGRWADFITLDLGAPALKGCDESTILDAWVFGTGNEAVAETCVGGQWEARTADS